MKVGDHVIYLEHCEWTSETLRVDKEHFTIGEVYRIKEINDRQDVVWFDDIGWEVRFEQISRPVIINNKLNKVLYSDYIEYDKYLISKETYEIITHKEK